MMELLSEDSYIKYVETNGKKLKGKEYTLCVEVNRENFVKS